MSLTRRSLFKSLAAAALLAVAPALPRFGETDHLSTNPEDFGPITFDEIVSAWHEMETAQDIYVWKRTGCWRSTPDGWERLDVPGCPSQPAQGTNAPPPDPEGGEGENGP